MYVILIILLLLACVVVSSVIARALPFNLPLPLAQIALGATIGQVLDLDIAVDPNIFLLIFIAPLLFLDGWRIPKAGLFHDKWTIAALAFGLVVVTVLGAGFFIHWIIPAMPLAIAFALAAVLSPTDAVAVSAIAARMPFPERLIRILEGEALLNDASGLVCLRFAVAAAATGAFSLFDATASFVWLVAGGVGIGLLVAFVAIAGKDWIVQHFGEESGAQILISLLIPFGAYLAADRLAASGILAAVAAGVMMGYEERSGRASGLTRIRRAAVWDALHFSLNGVIFVLLGQQLPGIVRGAGQVVLSTGKGSMWWLVVYILAISAVLVGVRFLWVWATLGLSMLRGATERERVRPSDWRLVTAASFAGARGALALSGIMTLPLTFRLGNAFPTRDLTILLAAGAIVVSLVLANAILPPLLKGFQQEPEPPRLPSEDAARIASAQAAIEAVERSMHQAKLHEQDADLYQQIGARIVARYREEIDDCLSVNDDRFLAAKLNGIERSLSLAALHAERKELFDFARSGQLTEDLTRSLVRKIDLQETRLTTS